MNHITKLMADVSLKPSRLVRRCRLVYVTLLIIRIQNPSAPEFHPRHPRFNARGSVVTSPRRTSPTLLGPRRFRKVSDCRSNREVRGSYVPYYVAITSPESTGVSADAGAGSAITEKANRDHSVRERADELQVALHQQSSQVRRLIRERDTLEDQDVRRAIEAGVGSNGTKPSPRLAAVNDELEQAICARDTTSAELDSVLSGGRPAPVESIPAASNSVRLLTLALLLLNVFQAA